MRISIADNTSHHLFNSLETDLIISKFEYGEILSDHQKQFILTSNQFIIGTPEYEFIAKNAYDISSAELISSLLKRKSYTEFIIDGLKYVVVNTSISSSTKKLSSLKHITTTENWQSQYDGRFGYCISTHTCARENFEIQYFNYGASLPYVRGNSTLAIVEKNGIRANILP